MLVENSGNYVPLYFSGKILESLRHFLSDSKGMNKDIDCSNKVLLRCVSMNNKLKLFLAGVFCQQIAGLYRWSKVKRQREILFERMFKKKFLLKDNL